MEIINADEWLNCVRLKRWELRAAYNPRKHDLRWSKVNAGA
jgi:hypothetical protein